MFPIYQIIPEKKFASIAEVVLWASLYSLIYIFSCVGACSGVKSATNDTSESQEEHAVLEKKHLMSSTASYARHL